ncbi:MAG: pyridoxal-phosphate dependent enzyme [Fuerstiella sp.]|nr:pyridoxal-phosphate dependent enzyme [Fuerstiella sp.]MCP4513122.1 pyridoxal-phosphate dependent enzyme [Fuerstiella sp.]MDG2127410.1 pyridoxal-phosphate dependent enzyme [Fuerstiella sp.]
MTRNSTITLKTIREAAKRIHGYVLRTPVVQSLNVGNLAGAEVFFKCENQQHIGAFKSRGACNAVFSLSEDEAAAGVVAHSSGNHAAALARAAQLRGITAHIVMPHDSATVKIDAVRGYGVEPTFCEPDSDSRQAAADKVIAATGATFIHPFNDERVIAGQGTTALELLEEVPDLDAIVVPVGGGGLLSGTLIAAKSLNPHIKVFAAEPEWADDAFRSFESGSIEAPVRHDTIADGLRTCLGTLTFPVIQELVDEVLLVSEEQIATATLAMMFQAKIFAEPSGAVPLAAVMQNKSRFADQRIGIIVSGGNLDPSTLHRLISGGNT